MNHFRRWTRGDNQHQQLTRVHTRPERKLYQHVSSTEDDTVYDRGNTLRLAIRSAQRYPATGSGTTATSEASMSFLTLTDCTSSEEEEELLSGDLLRMTRLRMEKKGEGNGGNHSSVNADASTVTRSRSRNVHFVEREIDPGDTISGLALRYGCKATLIKRINNIMSDQEFYGLRTIKVPVVPNSTVEESLMRENELRDLSRCVELSRRPATACLEPSASPDGSQKLTVCHQKFVSFGSNNVNGVPTSPNCSNSGGDGGGDGSSRTETKLFLQRMDRDLEKIRSSTITQKNSLEEVAQVLTSTRFRPLVVNDRTNRSGGAVIPRFKVWVVAVVLVLVALPILIVLFVLYGRNKSS